VAAAVVRDREEMLQLAQRAGGVATFEWNFREQVARCSSEFFRIFGVAPRDGGLTATEWGRFVHPDDRERMNAHLTRALAGTEAPNADYRILTADGSTRWLSYVGELRNTPAGDRMLGTVVDITERKRLESQLRHHATELEHILESIGEGFVVLNREFRYVYVNRAAERMLSHAREELLGRPLWEVFPRGIAGWAEQLESAMATGAIGHMDVHVPDWNRWYENELEEIFGLAAGTFTRTEAGFFEFAHPDDREMVRTAVDGAVESGSDYLVEFRFKHGTGEWRWMEGRGRGVYPADGTPRTLYGIGIDITARKHAEIALQHAKEAAESANQLKDQFLATLSHELRTPLNAILGYARMLQTHTIADEKRQHAIDVIERNAVAQHRLVEDLLDMSRIATGRIRLNLEPVPVFAVLREAFEGVKPAAEAKDIVLHLALDPFAGTIRADPTRLQQVFWNLLTNAVKFTPAGGRVAVALRGEGVNVEVAVSDTGLGIAPDFLPFACSNPFGRRRARRAKRIGTWPRHFQATRGAAWRHHSGRQCGDRTWDNVYRSTAAHAPDRSRHRSQRSTKHRPRQWCE
jgi:PAS domain S-box-containing protein